MAHECGGRVIWQNRRQRGTTNLSCAPCRDTLGATLSLPPESKGSRLPAANCHLPSPMSSLPVMKGTLDVLVLKALSLGPMHGFEISCWLDERSGSAENATMRW